MQIRHYNTLINLSRNDYSFQRFVFISLVSSLCKAGGLLTEKES